MKQTQRNELNIDDSNFFLEEYLAAIYKRPIYCIAANDTVKMNEKKRAHTENEQCDKDYSLNAYDICLA